MDPTTDRARRIARRESLTAREREIMQFVAAGLSNEEIGAVAGVSSRTVQTHIASALKKTNTRNRAHLAVFAVRAGIVPLESTAPDRGTRTT